MNALTKVEFTILAGQTVSELIELNWEQRPCRLRVPAGTAGTTLTPLYGGVQKSEPFLPAYNGDDAVAEKIKDNTNAHDIILPANNYYGVFLLKFQISDAPVANTKFTLYCRQY
jgi:hypothetical protein